MRVLRTPDGAEIPLGHSISAHWIHGWCAHCRDHDWPEEVNAWRLWAMSVRPEIGEATARYYSIEEATHG